MKNAPIHMLFSRSDIRQIMTQNHKGNTYKAADCLVNETGETPGQRSEWWHVSKILVGIGWLAIMWNLTYL